MAQPSPQIPQLPPGLKYYKSAVRELLEGSMYLDHRVTGGSENVVLPLPGSSEAAAISGVQMFGGARALSVRGTVDKNGIRGAETLGAKSSSVDIRWVLSPDDDRALPAVQPLPRRWDPAREQRFTMMDVDFRLGGGESSFRGFGTGRTYPAGGKKVSIGACGKILSGQGAFADAQGSFVMNGFVSPPNELDFELLIRVLNPGEGQLTQGELTGGGKRKPASKGPSTYVTFLGSPDPKVEIHQDFAPDGTMLGATVSELLRLASVSYDSGGDGKPLTARTDTADWVAGHIQTKIRFNPFSSPGSAKSPMPWHTEDTVITFYDIHGESMGTIGANIQEGRGFLAQYPGFPAPVFNLVGFGAFQGGTAALADAKGMLSTNAAVAVSPAMLSNMYVLRLDP